MNEAISNLIKGTVTILLLVGAAVDRMVFHATPVAAGAYHERVRAAAAAIPTSVGTWFGKDTELPPAAVAMLHPNTVRSARYTNALTGHSVEVLLIQCSDARDVVGHYPPRCYPAQGWTQLSGEPIERRVAGLSIHATRYGFSSPVSGGPGQITVDDFMILPDGEICPDITGVDRAARNPRLKHFGVAHFQFVSDATLDSAEREDALRQLIASFVPLIDTIRSGVQL